jgi:hypothetical protein
MGTFIFFFRSQPPVVFQVQVQAKAVAAFGVVAIGTEQTDLGMSQPPASGNCILNPRIS